MLYSIGELSSIVRISKDTLRYYDNVGVLKPCKIDSDNGYRYYNDEQIKVILQILEYKSYGLSLEEIKKLLSCNDDTLLWSTLAKQSERIAEQQLALSETMLRIKNKICILGGVSMNLDKKKILIVDDVEFMRTILLEILENSGYIVSAVPGGKEALENYAKEKPDLVLMDIEMPEMDGIECTKKLREFDEHAKIMILSAHFNQENLDAAYGAGACYFQPKPFMHDVLLYGIQRIFDGTLEESQSYAEELELKLKTV